MWRHASFLRRRVLRSWPVLVWLAAGFGAVLLHMRTEQGGQLLGSVQGIPQDVSSLETARLQSIPVQLGQEVRPGDVVAMLASDWRTERRNARVEAAALETLNSIDTWKRTMLNSLRQFQDDIRDADIACKDLTRRKQRDEAELAELINQQERLESLAAKQLVGINQTLALRPQIAALEKEIEAYPTLMRAERDRLWSSVHALVDLCGSLTDVSATELLVERGFEGIACDPQTGMLYIAVEGSDHVLEVNAADLQPIRKFVIDRTYGGKTVLAEGGGGLEGIAFVPTAGHPQGGRFFLVNQSLDATDAEDGSAVFECELPLRSESNRVSTAAIVNYYPQTRTDLSDIFYDDTSHRLLVLSDNEDVLIEMNDDGRIEKTRRITGQNQEGVTIARNGTLYIAQDTGQIIAHPYGQDAQGNSGMGPTGIIFRAETFEPSGLTYHPQRNSLFVVDDEGYVCELGLDGTVIRDWTLLAMLGIPKMQADAIRAIDSRQDSQSKALDRILDASNSRLETLSLRAMSTGVVSQIFYTPGSVVPAGEPIVRLISRDAPYVMAFLPEGYSCRVEVGAAATACRLNRRTETVTAKVVSISPEVRWLPGRIAPLPGQNLRGQRILLALEGDHSLIPGETVTVTITGSAWQRFWSMLGSR